LIVDACETWPASRRLISKGNVVVGADWPAGCRRVLVVGRGLVEVVLGAGRTAVGGRPRLALAAALAAATEQSGEPLVTYSPAISAVRPQSVTSTNVVSSTHSPAAVFRRSLTASVMSVTAVPLAIYRSSGSRVTLPIRITLL